MPGYAKFVRTQRFKLRTAVPSTQISSPGGGVELSNARNFKSFAALRATKLLASGFCVCCNRLTACAAFKMHFCTNTSGTIFDLWFGGCGIGFLLRFSWFLLD